MAHHIPKITYGGLIQTEIVFEYPPKKDNGERFDVVEKIQTSVSGVRQVQVDYTEAVRELLFSSLSETTKAALQTFFLTHARFGKSFRYYEDQNSVDYVSYELRDLKFDPKRVGIRGENLYAYELPLTLRRVEGITSDGDYTMQEILNNQVTPVAIDELTLDSTRYRSIKVYFEIWRKTNAEERVSNGFLTATYKESTDTWDITPEGTYDGDNHGLSFSMDGAQVQYQSDDMAGTGYQGEIFLRNFTIIEG